MNADDQEYEQVTVDYDVDLDSDHYSVEALDDDAESCKGDPLASSSVPPLDHDDQKNRNDSEESAEGEQGRRTNLSLSASFFKRRFVGETSGSLIASRTLYGDTVEEILQGVWAVVKPVIRREVVFMEENGNQVPIWAENEPSYADLQKFVYMQNKRRRRINTDQIDSKLLISWRTTDIRVHVHVYSTAVSCKQLWDLVERQLVRFQDDDRAGAPSNQSLSLLADELRELYGGQFTGHASSWKLWANYIHTAPAHERERRMSELPPYSIIKFFRSVPISEAVQLETTRNGLSVASTINDAYTAELAVLEDEVDQMITLGQRVKHRISALRTRSSINSSLVSAMQNSIRPEENEISQFLAGNVTDMQDIDHS